MSIIYFDKLRQSEQLVSKEDEFYSLKEWVKKNDFVIDVGSNIGRYSFELSNIVGPKGHVFSFEPMLRLFFIITCLCFLVNFKNISLFNSALGSKFSFNKFTLKWMDKKDFIFDTNTQTSLSDNSNSNLNTNNISFRTILRIDDLKISRKIKFIKIDVEGYEIEVLKGAEKTLKKNMPVILVEANSIEVKSFLYNLGYILNDKFNNSRNWVFIHKK